MSALTLIFGAIVGFSLGLTGGGGAIFAVPLLIYGLGLSPRDAVGISMMTVGVTAFAGFVQRMRRRQVELPTGTALRRCRNHRRAVRSVAGRSHIGFRSAGSVLAADAGDRGADVDECGRHP